MGYQTPLKNATSFFLPSPLPPPPLNWQIVQAPLSRQFPLYIGFLWTSTSKLDFSVNPLKIKVSSLKLVSAIFYQIFIFHQIIALQKLWKMFFISSKKRFSFSRYSSFSVSVFPSFSPCQPFLQRLVQDKS